jgi:lysophospholipase L1-like esterase
LLGFRNRAVPIVTDVVALGDSQTVGRNATLDWSWPSRLAAHPDVAPATVYSMASGGWGPVQYLYTAEKALAFRPRVLVVAFYTGNDAFDAVKVAYHLEAWRSLRALPEPPPNPPPAWPPRETDLWKVDVGDARVVLTPRARLIANDRDLAATREGYRIMAEVGRRIGEVAARGGAKVVFTVIPTKELVYAEAVRRAGVAEPAEYAKLVADESANVAELARALRAVPGATYVDLVAPLQKAALDGVPLYLPNQNGHPISPGYELIAQALAPAVAALLPEPLEDGLVRVAAADGPYYALVRDGGLWRFPDPALAERNGWTLADAREASTRDVAHLSDHGVVLLVDRATFGPTDRSAREESSATR